MSFPAFSKLTRRLHLCLVKQSRCFFPNRGKSKLSYYHEKGTCQLVPSTLGDMIDKAADDSGDDVALSFPFQGISKTYHQFKEETDQLAAGLINLGLKIGDRIAIYGPNSYQWLLTQYAALKVGLIPVNINPSSTEKELLPCVEKVGCRTIVSAESFKRRDCYKTLCAAIPEITESRPGQIHSQRLKMLQHVIMISDKAYPGTYKLADVTQADDSSCRRQLNEARKKVQFDSIATVLFTSGTTGTPKAAFNTHFQLINQAISYIKKAELDKEKPVICLQVPLFHGFGNLLGIPVSAQCRGKCVFPAEHFDPVSSLNSIVEERCTMTYGVPTMFNEMLQHLRSKKYDIRHWKKVVVGASPVPLELVKSLREECGLIVLNGYGSTESNSCIAGQSPSDFLQTFGSAGKPIEFTEVKIVDKDGNIVPVGTNGEVLSRSPFTFCGYWDEPQKTAEVLDVARWLHTGDIGRMDEDGNVYITGRIKDIVIRGGVNIYPTDIENFLMTHRSIQDVYVVGVPDERLGEEICASIKLKAGCCATEDEIKGFCKDQISSYKIPRYVIFCEEFPKTESGKIMKHKLRELCMKRLKL